MSTTSISTPLATPSEEPRTKKRRVWLWVVLGAAACFFGLVALGVVATIFLPNVLHRLDLASVQKAKLDILKIQNVSAEFAANNGGRYPDNIEVLVTPDVNGATYLGSRTVPLDPWGRKYLYEAPGTAGEYPRVFSYGKDGRPGGEGADADIATSSASPTR